MESWIIETNRCREIAALAERAGDLEGAARALRRAADWLRARTEAPVQVEREAARAELCARIGELLWEKRLPDAILAFQEAADAYGLSDKPDMNQACARKVLDGVRMMRSRPAERLDLLIARYDRELRDLEAEGSSPGQRGELQFKVGTVLQRRDRFEQAAERYRLSLQQFELTPEGELDQARCHHRLADLHHHELRDDARARQHYERAIELYAAHEPTYEGEQMNRVLCEWHLRELSARSGA